MGRAQQHTPHQTSPTRGRMWFLGCVDGAFVGGVRALPCLIVGRMQYAPTLTVDCMGSFCQSSDLDAPSDVPGKGTNAGARLFRRAIYWGRPGLALPVCGAYAIRPYPDGRLFLSEWVGAYCIRPIKRPRQGDECGCPVISQGNLLGVSGPCRARLWGVCCCALRLRSIVWDHFANRPTLTPHKTSPTRE